MVVVEWLEVAVDVWLGVVVEWLGQTVLVEWLGHLLVDVGWNGATTAEWVEKMVAIGGQMKRAS